MERLSALRKNEWVESIEERFGFVKVSVADVRVEHQVKIADFMKWLERPGRSPREITQRQKNPSNSRDVKVISLASPVSHPGKCQTSKGDEQHCAACEKYLAGVHFHPVPARKKSNDEHQFKVGDSVSVTLHTGRIVDGTVRAIVEKTDGIRLQVDYGKDETALVELGGCIGSDS